MTKMENIVMNMTGCPRETANLVVNAIYQEVEKVEKENCNNADDDNYEMLRIEQQGGII
jgi:hypothetical protein